jgi:phage-related protein
MPHSRPMPIVGRTCHELRVLDRDRNWRIVYHLFAEAVVILEVFSKTTTTTPERVIRRCQRRLRMYLDLG